MKKPKDKRTKEYKEWKANQKPIEGLGDVVEKITQFVGIKHFINGKDCGCDKRKEKLNKLFPVNRKPLRCFSPEQYNLYKEFVENRTLNLWNETDIKTLIDLYAHVFAVQYHSRDLCRNCQGSAKILFRITEELDRVYDTYND